MKKNALLTVMIVMFSFGTKAQEHVTLSKIPVNSLTQVSCNTSYLMLATNGNIDQAKKDFYLQKSRNQKTAAWILLGGGNLLIGTAFLLGNRSKSTFDDAAAAVLVGGIGVLSSFGSIPLFIAARKNKVKAALTIRIDHSPSTGKQMRSFGVSIPIG